MLKGFEPLAGGVVWLTGKGSGSRWWWNISYVGFVRSKVDVVGRGVVRNRMVDG